jgi:hypothetical protein
MVRMESLKATLNNRKQTSMNKKEAIETSE